MTYPFKYVVSFRVRHPSMDPVHISKNLNLTAEQMWKAGNARKTPIGKPLEGVYESSYCTFRLQHAEGIGLTDFLKIKNSELFPNIDFLQSIRSSGGDLEYFVGWFANADSGEVFDLELMNQLVELGISLSVCVYGKVCSLD